MENIEKTNLYEKVSSYIRLYYFNPEEESSVVCESEAPSYSRYSESKACKEEPPTRGRQKYAPKLPSDFSSSVIDRLEDSFGTLLIRHIRDKGKTNADVYKDANIDRRLFSKIISNEGYSPTKGTVLALAIALKLNLDETTSFLKSAGYALSHSSKADLVVEYFIDNADGNYNIDVVNDALEYFGQPTLGSRL
ncbi:MAG: hypothetical protein J6T96_14480 [Bacteroidales bacterium]|nr:hypothetical protein [Bacteroidales bacterium]